VAVNQAQVTAAISSGIAFDFLDRQGSIYTFGDQVDLALQRRLGGPDRINLDTIVAIVIEYQRWRQAGEAINRATNPDTPYVRHLPTIGGCAGPYEYQVVVPFDNPVEDKQRTKDFVVTSDMPLTYNQIQYQAAVLGAEWAALPDTGPGAAGDEGQWIQSGMARVTGAARCA
jgi:hypothetical protein